MKAGDVCESCGRTIRWSDATLPMVDDSPDIPDRKLICSCASGPTVTDDD